MNVQTQQPSRPEARVVALLRAGVPLSLLVDLADPDGPDSAAIARAERELARVS